MKSSPIVPRAPVQVAVGLIMRQGAQGNEVLLAWRDAALHQGNRHEFPGGKVEAGETPRQALWRELHEELGIRVTQAQALRQISHHYPEKTVCLQVFRVTDWQGEPVGQQGQALLWVPVQHLSDYRFPEANAPIVRLAQLPGLYAISPPWAPDDLPAASQSWPPGSWVYWRQPHLSPPRQLERLRQLHAQRPDVQWVVSWAAAQALTGSGTDQAGSMAVRGVHLRHAELAQVTTGQVADWQAQGWVVLASCHDQASLQQAETLGVDAVTLAAVHPTPTHPGQDGIGWAQFAQRAQQCALPVYALGGLGPGDLDVAHQHGAFGVAGIRGFLGPGPDPS